MREERDARLTATAGYDIEREAWDLAVTDRVQHVMGGLPAGGRQAIELATSTATPTERVATLLDAPEGTIKSRIRAGLKRMRADLVDTETGRPWHHS